MRDPETRQDAEHRLANLVSRWVSARDEKAIAMKEHNDGIKAIEEAIEGLSAQIQGGGFQGSLPFDPDGRTSEKVDQLAAIAKQHGVTGAERREDGSTVVKMGKDWTLTVPPTKNSGTLAGDVVEGIATAGLAVEAGKGRGGAR